jgi:hypothetical protein
MIMSIKIIGVLAVTIVLGAATMSPPALASLADAPEGRGLPMHAVIAGRNLQPRGDQLEVLGYSDLTSRQAAEVDHLYRELMRNGVAPGERRS